MVTLRSRRSALIVAGGMLLGLLLVCRDARADGINVEFVVIAGLALLVPLMLFEVLVEGAVIRRVLGTPFGASLWVALGANMVSLLAGVPVKAAATLWSSNASPKELISFCRFESRAILLWAAVYFVVTCFVEYWVIRAWAKRHGVENRGRVLTAVLAANVLTYAVLTPAYYLWARPLRDVRELTDTTAWARQPPARVYYVEPATHHLRSIFSDGSGGQEVVPFGVRDYQLVADGSLVLFRDDSNRLCLWRRAAGTRTAVWTTPQEYSMDQVAFRPDGGYVCYLERAKTGASMQLTVFETETGKRSSCGVPLPPVEDRGGPRVAWTEDDGQVLVKAGTDVTAYRVGDDGRIVPASRAGAALALAPVYGRFGRTAWAREGDWGPQLREDRIGRTEITSYRGLENHVRVTWQGQTLSLRAGTGLLYLPGRFLTEVGLLASGREAVIEQPPGLYLFDIEARRLGRLVEGERFVLTTDRYLKSTAWDAAK